MLSLSLNGKTALVGGSTQGIGLAAAQELAALGARCILISRNESKLQEALKTLDTGNNQIHDYLVADYSHPEQVHDAVAGFLKQNTVDILINNTGGPAGGAIIDAPEDAFIKTFQQHLICNHILAKLVVPGMKSAGYGRIINVISTSVKVPLKNLGVSNTIRGAVASWAKTLANELGAFGITVNNVLPGTTITDRLTTIINNNVAKSGKSREEIEQQMMAEIPARRFGKPEEIAAAIAFLATPAASYINGVSLPVDGGRTGSI